MKYRLKYIKGEGVRYISHLDIMRAFSRGMRRARLPLAYSQGFNPHMKLSFGPALPVGTTSQGEYFDIELTEKMNAKEVMDLINQSMPEDLKIIMCIEIDDRNDSIESQVLTAEYEIEFKTEEIGLADRIKKFLEIDSIVIQREIKGKSKTLDIRPMIKKITPLNGNKLTTLISTGSRGNLKPDQLFNAMKQRGVFSQNNSVTAIKRINMYIDESGKDTPLDIF